MLNFNFFQSIANPGTLWLTSIRDCTTFGSPLPNRSWSDPDLKYKFGFNGMEKDNEINVEGGDYDFGARIYDSRLGRWLSLDPMQKNYSNLSNYNFVGNSPLLFIDGDGKKIIIHYETGEMDGNGHHIIKSYVYGSGLPVPDNEFLIQTIVSLDMIYLVNVSQYPNTDEFPTPSDMLKKLNTDPLNIVNIISSNSGNFHQPPLLGGNPMQCNETTVLFNSTTSTFSSVTSPSPLKHISVSHNDYRLPRPPAANLNHELKHAFNYLYYYDNYMANRLLESVKVYGGNTTTFPNREEENTTLKTDNDFGAYYCLEPRVDYFNIPGPQTSSATEVQTVFVNDPVNNSSSNSEFKLNTQKN